MVPAHPTTQLRLCFGSDQSSTKNRFVDTARFSTFFCPRSQPWRLWRSRPFRPHAVAVRWRASAAAGAAGATGAGRSGEVRSPRWSVSPSVWTYRSGPVGDVDLPSGLLVWGRVCVLGLWVSIFPGKGSWAPSLFFASLGRSAAVFVCWMYPGPVALAGVRPPRRALWNRRCCSRATCNRRCLICVRLCCYTRAAAACSALCAVFGG